MFRIVQLGLLSCIALALNACGGGGGGEGPEEEVIVVPVSGSGGDADGDTSVTVSPEPLAIGASSAGFLPQGEAIVYQVPPEAQVILTTQSGNADLFLYSSVEPVDENFLCASRLAFIEDSCFATDFTGDVYAHVYGRETSNYALEVSSDCSVEAVNEWVYRNMRDYYLYSDNVPVVNPSSYASTTELTRDLRFEELDPYSGVRDAGGQSAFFDEGVSFGFGFSLGQDSNGNLRILYVYDDSPFGRAGIKRSDILLGLNNELWNEISNERYFALIGDEENPLPNSWQFIDGETGESKSVTLTLSEFRLNTVLHSAVYSSRGFDGKTGYIVFNDFIRISEGELDAVIQQFNNEAVTELVLDLRYNPGGFTFIAEKLASQIGGADLAGEVLVRYEYNEKYSSENFQEVFETVSPELDLDRVVVLTTGRTASSSELVINALKPYIDVVVIGEKTEGKAFISAANRFCGKSLNAMEAQGVNVAGDTVAGGIEPNCYAADDYTRSFGGSFDGIEGMLESALDYVVFGICDAAPLTKRPVYESSRINERQFGGGILDVVGQ